jgi:uncharacterized protein
VTHDAAAWIRELELAPHPEGGFFRETWRSPETLAGAALPPRFAGARALGTAILYLLPAGEFSRLHRLRADEVWHLYDGGPLHLHLLEPGTGYRRIVLGRDIAGGERLQAVVPHGTWFGAETPAGVAFALAGCTVAPGFDFADFELGSREALLAEFPAQRDWVVRLTAARES